MTTHQPIHPAKALELVKSRNLDDPGALLADFAAAGLIKTYALMREIRLEGGEIETIRDAQIPPGDWHRIVASDKVSAVLNGGTVRLEGSGLRGGDPSVLITGISFSEPSLAKLLDRYCADSSVSFSDQLSHSGAEATLTGAPSSSQTCKPDEEDVSPIKPGAITASVAQTEQATGLSRTTIDKLMREGALDRIKVGRRTLITVESIERFLGVKFTR